MEGEPGEPGEPGDHDALIARFTGLTGVAPHEVSFALIIAAPLRSHRVLIPFIRLNNTSKQISGISPAQPPSTTPHSKKPLTARSL